MSFSASGVQSAYERVRWAEGVAPQDADLSKVYVFGSKRLTPDLTEIQAWLDGFGPTPRPSVTVIAPKSIDEISSQEYRAFHSACYALRVCPVSRPDDDHDLLGYVQGFLPVVTPSIPLVAPHEIAAEPNFSFPNDSPEVFEGALARLLQPKPAEQRFD